MTTVSPDVRLNLTNWLGSKGMLKLATTPGVPPVAVEAIADGLYESKVLPDGKVHRWA